ncbi:serine threonine- kinase receptor isoform A [Chlorella sorokiniana]|uniref:Serine threonine-kinase receptor isoform A n=1 Tax=Chlorella sorokiniana TaxID=3076 RepID=A0A2P6TIU9_CHLSO|nr:serine threonine- kinase receptor isoform A [Chlorella sorokiniana]|eukprot:PRW39166.1 serine threonine- kinase receptor isoform A [Chlorella sorokiniana]
MGRPRLLLWAAAALWLTLAGSTEDASTAERRALLRFRDSTSGWERLEAAAGPGGLPGWAADSPLHHCQWGGVACCSVKDHVADALGGSPAEAAGPPPAADLEHLRDLPWLVMLELSGIALSMPSVERLLQPRKPPLQLWSLVLQRASLNAPLPPALLQVPSLREMDLSFAGVQGPLPPQRHCSLQHLNLAGNWELTGALPQALLLNPSNTAALELQALAERGTTFCDVLHLNLSSTGISGQLPELPDNTASSLATLDLSNTRLGSTLPSNWPFNAPYLFYLDLTNASLRGTVPPSWWDDILNERKLGPRTPDFLYLGGNQLTGAVPLGWAAIFTPGDSIRSRQEASSAHRTISDLQARVASHSYRMRYRSEQHILRTALFPGNERLCLQPGQALGLVQARPLMLGRTSRSMVMLGQLEGVGEVAVKALHISPQLLAAARREVRLLHRCANRHPNLVQLHGLCHTHPFLLVVTELCAGGDLQSLLHMPEMRWHARGAGVALDVCRGVAFMHSQGVVWADCKPGNVLLTADWQAKVTDLGTSRLLRGNSTAQSSATPAYAAPEQLLNGRVGLPSDVFSLGLLLHDLCTGEQPALISTGGMASYRRSLEPGRDCPVEVAQLIERCKAPLSADRPSAAAGPAPSADLEPLRDLPWLVMLELSGIAVSMHSVERLVQPREPRLQLYSLVLRRASLNAPLPPALLQAKSLRELDLSFSGIRGPLPPQRRCTFQRINLAGNWQLSGPLPQALLLTPNGTEAAQIKAMSERGTDFCDLLHLNLSSTGISGQLPELPDGSASSLATLDLSNTRLDSILPASWPFNAPYLFYLDLTNASMRGEVPPSWCGDVENNRKLGAKTPDFLYLGSNHFTGSVPLDWAAAFTPGDSMTYRNQAAAVGQGIADLLARVASHRHISMRVMIRFRDVYVTTYRLQYRSEKVSLRIALYPGNERLCLQPDQTLGLVQERVQILPIYQTLLDRLCQNGSGGGELRSRVGSASLLALMVLLSVAVLAGAAHLQHGSLSRRWCHLRRWWRAGYMPARRDGIASQSPDKEASWRSAAPTAAAAAAATAAAAAAAAATPGGSLELQVRPGQRMGAVLQAIELAQASARASSGRSTQRDSWHSQQAQQVQQAQQSVQEDSMPLSQEQQEQQQHEEAEQAWQDLHPAPVPADAKVPPLPPLPLLPSTALVLPQHEGQPLMLGRTSRSMVMLGRLEGVGEVAVKALHISPQLLAAARREVRLLHRCANRHPNLVQLHGLCHTHPFLLVVTELCAGGDLHSLLHLPEMRWHARGAGVALDVCRGVAFMHSQGVVWGDCKPGNVLLTADWQAKVTDLGTSRLLCGNSTAQSSATPAYAAPEQLLNGRVGLPSDVFSLGLLLHDLCTGEQPALVSTGGMASYRRPLEPGRDCPVEVAQLIERCKAPLPADRPTAAALLPAVLLAVGLLASAWAAAAAPPPPMDCFDCPWLELPLDEWTALAGNSSRSETLPWGQVVTLHPMDYRRLGEELCECVLDSLEGPLGTHQLPQHYVRSEGTQFVLHGTPLRFSGFNAAQALSWAASGDPRLLDNLEELFADAAALGLKMSEPPWVTLQPEPGVLNETVLQWLAANGATWPICFGQDWAEISRLPHIGYSSAHMYQSMRGSWDDATRSECGWECAMSWFKVWLQAHIQASGEAIGKPFVLEEWGKQWSEQRHVQAGAVAPPFEAAEELRKAMPPEEKQWLADVEAMQAAFRHDALAQLCMAQVKQEFASLFSGYSSNSTLDIVRGMVADATEPPAGNISSVAAADGGP